MPLGVADPRSGAPASVAAIVGCRASPDGAPGRRRVAAGTGRFRTPAEVE
jgi:hypothetical protein